MVFWILVALIFILLFGIFWFTASTIWEATWMSGLITFLCAMLLLMIISMTPNTTKYDSGEKQRRVVPSAEVSSVLQEDNKHVKLTVGKQTMLVERTDIDAFSSEEVPEGYTLVVITYEAPNTATKLGDIFFTRKKPLDNSISHVDIVTGTNKDKKDSE